jgi:DNA invertase Pin-like site-specific DNA recombinase
VKTAAYIRVSTTGQNLEGQRREIERWILGNVAGPEKVIWFEDRATGNNTNRPGFKALQKAVFHGEVQTVIVYKLDRVSRSLIDGLTTIQGWLEKGVRLVSTSQQFDFSGSTGKLIASVLFSVAEMEQETRRERQQAGIAVAKERGIYKGRKKGTTKGSQKRALELQRQGLTVSEISNVMGVSRQTVYRYLKAA